MKKNIKFAIKSLVFLALLAIVLGITTYILIPKFYYNSDWPTSSTFLGFYEMEENTIDVVFLGSSHCVSAFSPQYLYNEFGITSYNLGCEQQNLITSYYWLKECLKYQSPQVVVLENYLCYDYMPAYKMNCEENRLRKAVDFMRLSENKIEFINALCENDESFDKLSFYFTNLRYHDRWKELTASDFTLDKVKNNNQMKGFSFLTKKCNIKDYSPYNINDISNTENIEMFPLMKEYLDKITALCEENDIVLILTTIPTNRYELGKHITTSEYAKEHSLDYYDFNDASLYNEVSYNFAIDNRDGDHTNVWGAHKLTHKIGEILSEKYNVSPKKNSCWDDTKDFYNKMCDYSKLREIEDLEQYLNTLYKMLYNDNKFDSRYMLFISVKKDCATSMTDSYLAGFSKLGLSPEKLSVIDNSYYAVISSQSIQEETFPYALTFNGQTPNGDMEYSISSGGRRGGSKASIKINGTEKAINYNGINIVLYDTVLEYTVDSVVFNTSDPEMKVSR